MRLTAVFALAATCAGCAWGRPAPLVFTRTFRVQNLPLVNLTVRLQSEHRRQAPRYVQAALVTLRTLGRAFAAYPANAVVLVDPPWHGEPEQMVDAITVDRVAWWTTSTAMGPELATARAICRRYWRTILKSDPPPSWFLDGLAEYTARRIVQDLFARENNSPGYAMYEARDFGGFVPRFVRIRLLPEADGDPLAAYRERPRAFVTALGTQADRQSQMVDAALAAKTVITLNIVERWVGRPELDTILARFVRRDARGRPTLDEFTRVASVTSGQDLSWLLTETLGGTGLFDYAVTSLSSEPTTAGAYETRVTVKRLADGIFSGATRPRVGPFESGRGMKLLVEFAGGERVTEQWDGRDEQKTFSYRSVSRAVAATIDPDRLVLLDVNRTNNSRTLEPRTAVAARRWAARWMMWLENALLNCSFFL